METKLALDTAGGYFLEPRGLIVAEVRVDMFSCIEGYISIQSSCHLVCVVWDDEKISSTILEY